MQLNLGLLSSTYQWSLTFAPSVASQAAIKEHHHVRINLKSLLALSIDTMTTLYISTLLLVNFNFSRKWDSKESRLSRVQGIIIMEQLTLPVLNG